MNVHWTTDESGRTFEPAIIFESRLPSDVFSLSMNRYTNKPMLSKISKPNNPLCQFTTGPSLDVMKEYQTFVESRDLYKSLGIPYKRCMLMHGPAGCGKSATISKLIEYVNASNGVVIHNATYVNAIPPVVKFINEIDKDRNILITIEDIDSVIYESEIALLELLDSYTSLNNVFLLFTTNNIKDIPSRIVNRPSRIDTRIEFSYLGKTEQEEYLSFMGLTGSSISDIVQAVQELNYQQMTIAELKELVILTNIYKMTPKEACLRFLSKVETNEEN